MKCGYVAKTLHDGATDIPLPCPLREDGAFIWPGDGQGAAKRFFCNSKFERKARPLAMVSVDEKHALQILWAKCGFKGQN